MANPENRSNRNSDEELARYIKNLHSEMTQFGKVINSHLQRRGLQGKDLLDKGLISLSDYSQISRLAHDESVALQLKKKTRNVLITKVSIGISEATPDPKPDRKSYAQEVAGQLAMALAYDRQFELGWREVRPKARVFFQEMAQALNMELIDFHRIITFGSREAVIDSLAKIASDETSRIAPSAPQD